MDASVIRSSYAENSGPARETGHAGSTPGTPHARPPPLPHPVKNSPSHSRATVHLQGGSEPLSDEPVTRAGPRLPDGRHPCDPSDGSTRKARVGEIPVLSRTVYRGVTERPRDVPISMRLRVTVPDGQHGITPNHDTISGDPPPPYSSFLFSGEPGCSCPRPGYRP